MGVSESKISTQISKPKVAFIGGVVVAITVLGLFTLFRGSKQQKNDSNIESSPLKNSQVLVKKPVSEMDLTNKIKIEYNNQSGTLSMPTIVQILELSPNLVEDELVSLTLRNRSERRRVKYTDQRQYEDLVIIYVEQIEQILENAQERILNTLQIERETFEESVVTLIERGFYQQYFIIQTAVRQRIKQKIPQQRQASNQEAKQVVAFQRVILEQKPKHFLHAKQRLEGEQSQLIPLVLNTMMWDLVYEKFKFEEEDLLANMTDKEFLTDAEVYSDLIRIQEAMMNIIGPVQMDEDMVSDKIGSDLYQG